ncbi:MAG: hypothetical protein E7360_02750 [Clostridiales bacterium]|nr:hypothetical protein [Clostridiales bacterium]
MKSYLLSVVITSVLIALSELIIPQGKLKSVVNVIFTVVLLISIISPITEIDLDEAISVFNPTESEVVLDGNAENYLTSKIKDYYEKEFKIKLLGEDLVAEKIIVEINRMEIMKIQIYLSNLVIPENNEHINNIVIQNYVAEILGVDGQKVEIYA